MKKQCVLSVVTKSGREDAFVVRTNKTSLVNVLKGLPEGACVELPIKMDADDKATLLMQASETALMIVYEEEVVEPEKPVVVVEGVEEADPKEIDLPGLAEKEPEIKHSLDTIQKAINNSCNKRNVVVADEENL